ncbi:hypothetical protein B0A49_11233 [Cryomyces minteri]|uniref:Uncharacterized protein n=1 Tax=Cryomyces minteri TaxID=331657 RepID=A0A4U0XCT9_9PEZI|nr:hypothetical protein B0A49_11233 [Cryomyces minteri]
MSWPVVVPRTPSKPALLHTPPSSDIEAEQKLPPSPPVSPKKRGLSRVARLLRVLRLQRAGRLDVGEQEQAWQRLKLTSEEYAESHTRLGQDEDLEGWYGDRVRYDFDPAAGLYTLRMPTATHEHFIRKVTTEILKQIHAVANDLPASQSQLANALKEIDEGGSPTIEFYPPPTVSSPHSAHGPSYPAVQDVEAAVDTFEGQTQEQPLLQEEGQEEKVEETEETEKEEEDEEEEAGTACQLVSQHSPDSALFHPSARYPPLIVEVSYSQKRKDMPYLAESYIIDSAHAVQCVVGLDVEYHAPASAPKRKKEQKRDMTATLSIWRPGAERDSSGEDVGLCVCDVDAVPFRSSDGEPLDGALTLSVNDILPSELISTVSNPDVDLLPQRIKIPFSTLTTFLAAAELRHAMLSSTTSAKRKTARPKKFKKRKRTPEEELSDGREEKYTQQELVVDERTVGLDGAWEPKGRRARVAAPAVTEEHQVVTRSGRRMRERGEG